MTATLLAPQMGIAVRTMILIISLVVGVYATLGGLRAVVVTDKLQYAIVALYILALAAWEPAWLADSGLGFILWGILAAGVGGTLLEPRHIKINIIRCNLSL